ncbi:MAG: WG repeat-containing protein [Leptospiraceae bacterium]|nr:WG repeat-containing protein [Leptospiraceae bacterium]
MPSILDKKTKIDTKNISKIARAKKDKNGLFGYIDQDYQVILDFKFDYVYNFIDGHAVIVRGNQYAVVDVTGSEIIGFRQVSPNSMLIGGEYNLITLPTNPNDDKKTIERKIEWQKRMAGTLLGTSSGFEVKYNKELMKFVIFPECFYEKMFLNMINQILIYTEINMDFSNSTFFCASYLNPPSEEATSILCNQFSW